MRQKSSVVCAALVGIALLLCGFSVSAAPRVLRATFAWPNVIDPAMGNDYASSSSLVNLYDTLIFPNAKAAWIPGWPPRGTSPRTA